MHKSFFFFVILGILFSTNARSQFYYRIECDISIKNKVDGGEGALILGRSYYDKSRNQMVYDIRFPEKEVWIIKDTTIYIHKNDQVIQSRGIDQYNQSTVFHKILEGQLNNYGLQGSVFSIEDISRDGELVITKWIPRTEAQKLGTILTSTVDDVLYGVVFKNHEGQIIGRQLFRDYTLVNGLNVPTEIIQAFYRDDREEYQIFSFSNIKINNPGNENKYAYPYNSK